ncbi:MAG: PAS domain S-box protein [Proteobacteria bacterium]|nr:PAS domain S-box protein [Pseudomonadota bacterium]
MRAAFFNWARRGGKGVRILGVMATLLAGATVAFSGPARASDHFAGFQAWFGASASSWSMPQLLLAGAGGFLVVAAALAWRRYRSVVRLNTRLRESLAEHKLIKDDLIRATAQLEDAIEAISDGFVLYDADERLVICNSRYKQLHPLAAHKIIPGANFEDIIRTAVEVGPHPSAIGRVDEWVEERLSQFRHPGGQHEYHLSDGRWLRYSEQKTSHGGTIGVRADITPLKRAEDALRENEARFRDIATSASDWFWEMDEHLRFTYFSDRFSEVTGVAEIQLLGKTRQETGIPNVDEGMWRQHLEDLDAHRPFRDFVHPRTSQNGETIWLSINGTPFFSRDGAFRGYRGTGSDITQQKRTEFLLRESEQRLKAILDHVPAALFLKDTEARYLLINRQFQEWFGIDPMTVSGKTAHDLFPKERAERYAMGDRKMLATWQVTTDEVLIPDHTGRERSFVLTKFPIFNAGKPAGFGGVMIDNTEHAQANRELRKSENRAEMANRTKSEFMANMSHELRTPLNAIIGFSEILKSGMLGPDSGEKSLEYANDIFVSGQHLLDLINDILDISKIELGSEKPNDVEIAVPKLVASILVLMRERARGAGVRIQTNFQGDLPLLCADERKLKQILINLMSNGIKFTHAGGQVTLDVRCGPESGYEFVVSDTGIGIAPEDIATALQPFGQIDSDLNRKYTGTGLGLPLATELTEMHGGSLDISSKPGVGTAITVRFPADRIVPPNESKAMPPTPRNTAN